MTSFKERQKSLFDHLNEAEKQHKTPTAKEPIHADCGTINKQTYRRIKCEMKRFRGKESIYKRPEATLRECLKSRTIPDHIKNPQKWVYYSLADVTPDQMSDATNTATALAFHKEMEERESANVKMETDDADGPFIKPTFHVSKIIKKGPVDIDSKITFKNRKVIMPEYVVGVTDKKKKSNEPKKEMNNMEDVKKTELKLDHLYDE